MLDTTDPVGDGREVAETKFFLILKTKWTVIGADNSKFVHPQPLPQIALVTMTHLTDVMRIIIS